MVSTSSLQLTRVAAEGVYVLRTLFANVVFLRSDSDARWVLVDAGVRGYAGQIQTAAEELFGRGTRPEAIVLTHGHFDHVGSLQALLERWPVPVYAHVLEMPHLTGRVSYPPPDPVAGGGLMAWSSKLLPNGPIDIGPHLLALPPDRTVPALPGWEWIHTPGHTAGHVSLFRAADRALVAGDALTTVKQESLTAVATQRPELHGPPAYFTPDWDASRESVRRLADLGPEMLVTGHGLPLGGPQMRHDLHALAAGFDRVARPQYGRYAHAPAVRRPDGTYDLPRDPFPLVAGALAAGLVATVMAARSARTA